MARMVKVTCMFQRRRNGSWLKIHKIEEGLFLKAMYILHHSFPLSHYMVYQPLIDIHMNAIALSPMGGSHYSFSFIIFFHQSSNLFVCL
jgi:hypothetical protein